MVPDLARHLRIPRMEAVFVQVVRGRATTPGRIRRELGRWQRPLAADADGWLGSTTGITN
jgi:hypothetical protein